MKKMMKTFLSLLLACLMTLSLLTVAFANQGNVTYEGDAEKFIFAPGSDYSPTDLFTDFKGVMPGDTLEQTVSVNYKHGSRYYARIYVKAAGPVENEAFLQKMTLTVAGPEDNNLFEESVNADTQTAAQISDWVLLGTFRNGSKVDLTVTLKVPIDMDDDFQDQVGKLNWTFKVEEYYVSNNEPVPAPKTGDAGIALYVAVGLGAAALGTLLVFAKKKKHA